MPIQSLLCECMCKCVYSGVSVTQNIILQVYQCPINVCVSVPDGDDFSRICSDVPAAVDARRILKRPPRTGDHTAGRPDLLHHIATGYTHTHTDRLLTLPNLSKNNYSWF